MIKKSPIVFVVTALMVMGSTMVFAHEGREVDGLLFDVGFEVEPAYEGVKNAVQFVVKTPSTLGHSEGEHSEHGNEMTGEVENHGSLFASSALGNGDAFTFEISEMLEGHTVPYHSHLDHDMTGTITVSQDTTVSGVVEIEIHHGKFEPTDVTVKSGTTLKWINRSMEPQNVTSGVAPGKEHAHEDAAVVGVEGLESTLQVEVTHVPTNVSRVMDLLPVVNESGHYTVDLIPTSSGQYRFRFFGTINGSEIDEVFESGAGRFSDVLTSTAIQFPETLSEAREIESAVKGAIAVAEQARDVAYSVSPAKTLAIIGVVLGLLGTGLSGGVLVMATRKR